MPWGGNSRTPWSRGSSGSMALALSLYWGGCGTPFSLYLGRLPVAATVSSTHSDEPASSAPGVIGAYCGRTWLSSCTGLMWCSGTDETRVCCCCTRLRLGVPTQGECVAAWTVLLARSCKREKHRAGNACGHLADTRSPRHR